MDLFALILACAVPGVEPAIVHAIVLVESDQQALAIHDNASEQSHFPADRMSARRTAGALLAKGHSLDLGLMQVNSRWLEVYGIDVEEALAPCRNIGIGSDIVARYAARCAAQDAPLDPLRCALSRYHSGRADGALDYADRVLNTALTRAHQTAQSRPDAIFVWRHGQTQSATETERTRSVFVTRKPSVAGNQAPTKPSSVPTGTAP